MSSELATDLAIEVENLGKFYRIFNQPKDRILEWAWRGKKSYSREFWALRGLSFQLKRGETVGIVGRNGSGKSTLLQLICGTLSPSQGRIQTQGRIAALLELGSGFNPEFTGRENVQLNAMLMGLSRAEIEQKFDAILSFADIGDFIDQPVKTYSSGMMLRLAFAVQAQVDPDILIVDEALAVGDARVLIDYVS
jgi:lipopolysaccharide transport system ATP-binding protein